MKFIDIDASRGAARSPSAACTACSAGSRLVHGCEMAGGKGENPFSPVFRQIRALIAVRKNSRSPPPAPEQYRVVFLWAGPIPRAAIGKTACGNCGNWHLTQGVHRMGRTKASHSGAVEAFCTPQKPNSAPATRRIWISSEPSVMR